MVKQSTGLLTDYLRSRRILAILPYLKGRILDFGCGTGALSQFVAPDNYVGVDPDRESIEIARKSYRNHRFYATAEIENLGKFDFVVALAVIEHLDDPKSFLRDLRSFMKPSGKLILTTPSGKALWIHTLGSKMGLFSRTAADQHKKAVRFEEIQKISRGCGLNVEFYGRFLLGLNQLIVLK